MMGETISAISYEMEQWASIAALALHCRKVCRSMSLIYKVHGHYDAGKGNKRKVKDPIDLSSKATYHVDDTHKKKQVIKETSTP